MSNSVAVTGMVLKAAPVGDYDRRMVILSCERGKITAFARGAKRPGSQLMAVSRPFVFGTFYLYEGRDSYGLKSAEIANYFTELAEDVEGACYGSYFLEFADYYTRENMDGTEMLKLLYQSLRAVRKPSIPNSLARAVFELKAMVINGEYTQHPPFQVSDSAAYAWEFVILSPVERLYTFTLTDAVLKEFLQCVREQRRRYIDREFHSLTILRAMT